MSSQRLRPFDGYLPSPFAATPKSVSSYSVPATSSKIPFSFLQRSADHPFKPLPPLEHEKQPPPISIQEKFVLNANPSAWQDYDAEDPEDYLHNPDPREPRKGGRGHIFTARGLANIGCLVVLCAAIITLFAAYPLITYFLRPPLSTFGAANLGGTNISGQVPEFLFARLGLVDRDTPAEAMHIPSINDPTGEPWDLVFSDEFNTPGRQFYPGDDPYWEAVDLHYAQTTDAEWYDPQQVTTTNGALRIWFNETKNHDLNFMGGMVTTWNKFCFTGGMVLASVSLPGSPQLAGLWPAIWTMGNLGRAGYGASLEGMWPYSYDACDVGTLPNQSLPNAPTPTNGDPFNQGHLSFLPGQRLSRCTCGDDKTHPGPKHPDGTWVGRSVPEIDVLEAVVNQQDIGTVSQTAQWAPFDAQYIWQNTTENLFIANASVTHMNAFRGGVFSESTSALSVTNQAAYTQTPGAGEFSTYGYEYKPGFNGSYITWINNGVVSWTMQGAGMGANALTGISQRPVSQEPMYLIANLGMSATFTRIDPGLRLPAHMDIDWIRLYQPPGQHNVGCSPPDFPTAAYIDKFIDAYTNPNLTVFADTGNKFPGNSMLGQC